MNKTIFQEYAQETKGSNPALLIVVLLLVVVAIAVILTSDGHYRVIGPGPLLIFLLMRASKKKSAEIKFFVNQHGNDFEFGYYDNKGKLVGPFPLDEYTYWYNKGSAHQNGWNFQLNFQINTGKTTIYLQEKIVARNVPDGWQNTPQQIGEGGGVFQCPHLTRLASLIDAAAETETADAPATQS